VDDQEGLYVVLVDDREMLVDSLFEGTLERSFGRAGTWAIAGTAGELGSGFRGYVVEAGKSKRSILIRPENRMEGDLLGVKLPTSLLGAALPGRGLLAIRGTLGPSRSPTEAVLNGDDGDRGRGCLPRGILRTTQTRYCLCRRVPKSCCRPAWPRSASRPRP
jgi:hypothetical protein